MKKFLIIVSLFFLLLIGGAVTLVLMSFNPDAYQKQVMASVKELTGRDLFVGGKTSVTWSPMPTIVMKNIRLSNLSQSKEDTMLSAESIRAEIEWASLFKTPLVVKSIELTKPVLLLERLESNRANFAFPFLLDSNRQLQEMDFLATESSGTKIDSVLIRGGRIRYVNHITGTAVDIADVNGELAVDSLRGPFRFKGDGLIGRGKYSLSVNTGLFKSATPVDLVVKIGESDSGAALDFSGRLTPDSVDMWFSGNGSFSVKKPNVLLESMGLPPTAVADGQAALGNLSVELTPVADILKDWTIRFGEGENATALNGSIQRTARGKVNAYDVVLGINHFNPAQWQGYISRLNWDWIESTDKSYPDVTFKFDAKTVPYLKDNIQDLSVAGQYASGVLTVKKASATLPGRTKVDMTGSGAMQGKFPILGLDSRIESDSVKTLLSWLKPDNNWIKETKMLQKGSFAGRINITPHVLSTNIRELKLDSSVVTGTVQRTLNEKPAYDFKVAVNNINIDAYTGWQQPTEKTDVLSLPMTLKTVLEKAGWMNQAAIRASVDVTDGQFLNVPVSTARIAGYLDKGVLKIENMNLRNLASANVTLSGVAEGVGRPQMHLSDVTAKFETRQLPLLLNRAGLVSSLPLITKAGEVSAEVTLSGGREGAWHIGVQASLSDANIRLNGLLESVETQPSVRDFVFDVAHPNFQAFMRLISPEFNALPKLDGTFKAKGILTGTRQHFDVKDGFFGVGIQRLTGSLTVDDKRIRAITADVSSPSLDLARFLPETAVLYTPAGGFGQKELALSELEKQQWNIRLHAGQLVYGDLDVRQAEVDLQLQNKKLQLVNLSGVNGTHKNAPVKISGDLDWNTTPTLTAAFDVKNAPLRSDFMVLQDVAFGGGLVSITGNLKARGDTPAEMAADLNGDGTVSVQGGQIIGVDIEQMIPLITRALQRNEKPAVFEAQFKRVLQSGKTALTGISGGFAVADGVVRMMDLTLNTANATANPTQVIWDIPRRNLEVSIPVTLNPLKEFPPFILGISVDKNKSSYTPNFGDLSAAVAGRVESAVSTQAQKQQAVAQQAAVEKREDRLRTAQQLAGDARAAVAGMESDIVAYPSEKAELILQSARDALALVNQASVREEPTDAQLIQMIEQSRLVLLKAEEFKGILSRETLFNTQHQMDTYRTRGAEMVQQLKKLATDYPDVVIFGRLAENSAQNQTLIEQANTNLPKLQGQAEVDQTMAVAADAYAKIEKAYAHAQRFDLSALGGSADSEADAEAEKTSQVPQATLPTTTEAEGYRSGYSSRGIKGTIGRAD